jgi:hypothetical protein
MTEHDALTAEFEAMLAREIEEAAASHAAEINARLDHVIAQNERLIQIGRALLFSLNVKMRGETDV